MYNVNIPAQKSQLLDDTRLLHVSCNVNFKRFDTFTRTNATQLVRTSLSSLAVVRLIALLLFLDAF